MLWASPIDRYFEYVDEPTFRWTHHEFLKTLGILLGMILPDNVARRRKGGKMSTNCLRGKKDCASGTRCSRSTGGPLTTRMMVQVVSCRGTVHYYGRHEPVVPYCVHARQI